MELVLTPETLVVFVDDTGHEALVPGQFVYGLGGCAILAGDLDAAVRRPWKEIRLQVAGSTDAPLHAAEFARNAKSEQMESVAAFFRTQPFARLGAIITTETVLVGEMTVMQTIARVLGNRIADVARWTPFRKVAIVFESSQRADAEVQAAFQGFELMVEGMPVPTQCYFMPKSAGEPALEVADFIVHAIGAQARRQLSNPGKLGRDFGAIFHGQDRRMVSFINVSTVGLSQQTQ